MINQTAINDCFKDLIGFRQNTDNSYPTLPDSIIKSDSGITVQDLHSLLTIENLHNCSKAMNEDFATYLENRRKNAIVRLINEIFTAKQLNENSKELLTEVKMYEGVGHFNDKIVKQDRFVGYRIENLQKDLSLLIRQIGLQFDTANPQFKLYIYNSSVAEPTVITIAHNKPVSFSWFNFPVNILKSGEGVSYLVGYYESELIGQAVKREQYLTRAPQCGTCEHANLALYKKWSQYFSIRPFYVQSDNLNNDKTKWEEGSEIYIDGNNWGLNLALSVFCDVSGLFCRNREIFVNALGKQIAVDFLNDMLFSTRDNQLKQKMFQSVLYALGDNTNPGMKVELEKAIKAINFSTSELNSICLPCQDDAYRIRYKSVY